VAFAELAAAAGTDDVFTVLDAISSNIEAERKHAESKCRTDAGLV
jgi:hypothetical protein